jgi:hypothetical protein
MYRSSSVSKGAAVQLRAARLRLRTQPRPALAGCAAPTKRGARWRFAHAPPAAWRVRLVHAAQRSAVCRSRRPRRLDRRAARTRARHAVVVRGAAAASGAYVVSAGRLLVGSRPRRRRNRDCRFTRPRRHALRVRAAATRRRQRGRRRPACRPYTRGAAARHAVPPAAAAPARLRRRGAGQHVQAAQARRRGERRQPLEGVHTTRADVAPHEKPALSRPSNHRAPRRAAGAQRGACAWLRTARVRAAALTRGARRHRPRRPNAARRARMMTAPPQPPLPHSRRFHLFANWKSVRHAVCHRSRALRAAARPARAVPPRRTGACAARPSDD